MSNKFVKNKDFLILKINSEKKFAKLEFIVYAKFVIFFIEELLLFQHLETLAEAYFHVEYENIEVQEKLQTLSLLS